MVGKWNADKRNIGLLNQDLRTYLRFEHVNYYVVICPKDNS
jgi:hypothetical protein